MPLDPSTTAALTSTIDNASSIIATQNINKKTREWNEKQYDKQRQHSLMDWEMQNAYNSPEQQMARLKAAGLNPNLVYGNGAEAMSNQAPRSTDTQSWRPEIPRINTSAGLMAGFDMQQKQAQTDNIKELTKVAQQEQMLKTIQAYATLEGTKKVQADTATAQYDLQQKNRLSDLVVHQAEATLAKTQVDTTFTFDTNERAKALQAPTLAKAAEEILNLRLSRAKTNQEIAHLKQQIVNLQKDETLKDWEVKLNKDNISKGDPAWMRILQMIISKASKDTPYNNKSEEGQPGYKPKRHPLE